MFLSVKGLGHIIKDQDLTPVDLFENKLFIGHTYIQNNRIR